jgi:hypothetical protein
MRWMRFGRGVVGLQGEGRMFWPDAGDPELALRVLIAAMTPGEVAFFGRMLGTIGDWQAGRCWLGWERVRVRRRRRAPVGDRWYRRRAASCRARLVPG